MDISISLGGAVYSGLLACSRAASSTRKLPDAGTFLLGEHGTTKYPQAPSWMSSSYWLSFDDVRDGVVLRRIGEFPTAVQLGPQGVKTSRAPLATRDKQLSWTPGSCRACCSAANWRLASQADVRPCRFERFLSSLFRHLCDRAGRYANSAANSGTEPRRMRRERIGNDHRGNDAAASGRTVQTSDFAPLNATRAINRRRVSSRAFRLRDIKFLFPSPEPGTTLGSPRCLLDHGRRSERGRRTGAPPSGQGEDQ